MISKDLLKTSILCGVIIGIIALIPIFIFYSCLALFLLSSIITVLYYRRFEKYELEDYKDTVIKGGVMGFISFLGFITVFIPCTLIISSIFKNYYNYALPYFLNLQALWLFVLILLTVGFMCAMTNGVTLMGVQAIDTLRKEK